MHDINFSEKENDAMDFSRLTRLTPRADSWSKVCARLDNLQEEKAPIRDNIIPFRLLSAIPFAASIALVALSILMTAFSSTSESVTINSVTSTEVASWYKGLGNTEQNAKNDEFETLDNYATLSYLLKEER